jgi:hypothetical protein
MPFANNNQREGFSSNSLVGSNFENMAFEYFKVKENILLEKNFEIDIGIEYKKTHRFDLGNSSKKIIIECKSHTWTNGENIPSAKMSVWNEAMFYFTLAPKEYKKIFFVLMDYSKKRCKTLLQYYIENHYNFISKDIIFYEYFQDKGYCEKYTFENVENVIENKKW